MRYLYTLSPSFLWLFLKDKSLEEALKRMVLAPKNPAELFEVALSRAKKVAKKGRGLTGIKRLEERRIEVARAYVVERLKDIALRSVFLEDLHDFHRELAELAINADEYKKCLSLIYGAVRIINKVAAEQRWKVRSALTGGEAARYRRQFFGRLRSILEDLEDCMIKVRRYQLELLKLPNVDPYLDSLIIAGPPNVGKSSLVRAISRAKPEVREYPFTTKSIIVGHIETGEKKIQVLDTPGLLDRPLEERNPIERQAILAMKHLRGVIVFLFDPTETCGFPLDYQLRVYREIKEHFGEMPFMLLANKIDIASPKDVGRVLRLLGKEKKDLILISALRNVNIDYFMEKALSFFTLKKP